MKVFCGSQIRGKFAGLVGVMALLAAASSPLAAQAPRAIPAGVPQLQFVPAEINLFAGQVNAGCSESGIPGLVSTANLCTPAAEAVDASGNTYIVDEQYNTVLKVDTSGNISVFAGKPNNSSIGTFSGDNGQAAVAGLNQPLDVAVDPSGNVYISDSGNGRIRKVTVSTGMITTFVGGGSGYFVSGSSGANVAIEPEGINFDPSGNLYIADANQQIIVKVNSTGLATLFAGSQSTTGAGIPGYTGDGLAATSATLDNPNDVASDQSGNIYISDFSNCAIREVTASNGNINTIAGNGTCTNTGDGGAAINATLVSHGLGTDLAGDIYISNGGIRKIDTSGNINTLTGNGTQLGVYGIPAASASFPRGSYVPRVDNYGNLLFPGQISATSFQVAQIGPNGDLQFGNQSVNVATSPQTVTLQNTGTATLNLTGAMTIAGTNPGDFSVASDTCGSTLAPGVTCTLSITFTPGATGTRSASIAVPSNAGTSPQSILLGGVGVQPIVTASPTSLNFGTELWDHPTSPLYVTLTNTSSTYTATLGSVASTDSDFTVNLNSCGSTLAPGATCQLSVTFEPQIYANQSYSGTGSILVSSTAPGDSTPVPVVFSLAGNGITYPAGVSATPTSIPFGNETEYTESNPQTIYVINQSGSPVSFTGTTISGPFVIYQNGCPSQLPNNYQCTYLVAFSPTTVSNGQTGTLSIPFTGATGSPLTVSLSGNGTVGTPGLSLQTQTYPYDQANFGTTPVGTPPFVPAVTQQVTVNNTGTAPMTNIVISISGTNASDFSETDNCAANSPIQPNYGNNCVITVSFSAGAAGPRTATLTVISNAGNSPQSVTLTGAGVGSSAQLQFTPAQLNLIAGAGGTCGSTMASTPAASAMLCNIYNAAQDYLGNTYLVETTYNVVYKIDISGNLTVFAGTPSLTGGYSGDSGPATSATLNGPTAVAADAFGNIFISDAGNAAVREVSGGTINTYINTALCGEEKPSPGPTPSVAPGRHSVSTCTSKFHPQGLVFDRSGDLYVADPQDSVVYEVPAGQSYYLNTVAGLYGQAGYNGDSISATTAQLNGPQDVAVDTAGNLYIADTLNYRVRKVDTKGNITTYAGYGVQGNNEDGYPATVAEINPVGVATNLGGDLYIGSGAGGIVRKVDTSGFISTVAGRGTGPIGGPAASAGITNAFLPRVDNSGDVLIPTGLQLLAAGPDGILQFGSQAVGVASDSLNVQLEDTGNNQLSFNTTIATVKGTNASDFSFGSFCGYNLMGGKTCNFSVTFTPGGTGPRSAYLSVPTNTAGTPQIVLLQGNGTGAVTPTATLSSIAFGNQPEGTTSAVMYATLTNTSTTSPLTIGAISITGTNSANFALATGNGGACGNTLAANTSCTIAVTFRPSGVLTGYTATLNVATNATGSPQTGTLTGNGTYVQPTVTLLPSPYSYGNIVVGQKSAAQAFTLTNTGTSPFTFTQGLTDSTDFAITGTTCGTTLTPGNNCTVSVVFQPQSAVLLSTSLQLTDSADAVTATALLSGTGTAVPAPVAALTPVINFPNTAQNTTATAMTATLSNTGNATLNISSILLGGANVADFALVTSTNPCGATLAAGASCLIAVTFTPLGTNTYTATITVTDNSATPTQVTTLNGTGTAIPAPVVSLSSTINFPNTTQNTTATAMTATLSNTGNATLNISSILLGGANAVDFAIVPSTNPCGATLAAGASCLIAVTFTPLGTSTYTATITVTDNSATPTQAITLNGTGTAIPAPVVSLSSTINFPNTTQGVTSAPVTVTLTNTGNATLNISSILLGGTNAADFAIVPSTNPCGATLAAGASCVIAVTFTPLGTNTYTATITVTDNATTPTQVITLNGTGAAVSAADFTITSNVPTQTVFGGTPATYTITVTPVGGPFTGTILLGISGLPTGSSATFTPPSLTPGSGPASSSLVITTLPQQARLDHHRPWLPQSIMVALLLPLLWWRRRKPFRSVRLSVILLGAMLGGAILSLSGCTGGLQLPSATYTLTVSGTSGNISHTTTVTLTVQ